MVCVALLKSRDEVGCVLKKKARFCSLNFPVLTGKIWLSILDEPYTHVHVTGELAVSCYPRQWVTQNLMTALVIHAVNRKAVFFSNL